MFADCSPRLPTFACGFAAVSVVDLDADGEPEFFVCGRGGPNRLLKWADGRMLDVAPPELADAMCVAAAAADVDADGRDELFLAGGDAPDRLFDFAGGRWSDILGERNPGGRSVVAIDRRGVGRYGFVVTGRGPLRLIEVREDGRSVDVAPSQLLDLPAAGGLVVGPFASPWPGLFVAAEPMGNRLWQNIGPGMFQELAVDLGVADPAERCVTAEVADLDGIGLVAANADGPHRLFVLWSDGTFRDVASPAFALPSPAAAVIAADFDGDGWQEVLFHNHREANRLFRLTPAGPVLLDAGAAIGAEDAATGGAAADLDGDGQVEVLLSHPPGSDRPLTLLKGPRAGCAWLKVRPLTRFGGVARGTLVTVTQEGRSQVRVVGGEPCVHFGLGRDAVIDEVTVVWPDGATAVIVGPPPLRTLDVRYPGG